MQETAWLVKTGVVTMKCYVGDANGDYSLTDDDRCDRQPRGGTSRRVLLSAVHAGRRLSLLLQQGKLAPSSGSVVMQGTIVSGTK